MKLHITSWLFTKLDDFLPFAIYMVEGSLHIKKMCFLLIQNSWETDIRFFFKSLKHVYFYLMPQFLIKNGYYIVPSPSTALPYWLFGYSFAVFLFKVHGRKISIFMWSIVKFFRAAHKLFLHWSGSFCAS